MNNLVSRTIHQVGFAWHYHSCHSDVRADVLIDMIPGDESLRGFRFWTCDLYVLHRFLGRLIVEQAMRQQS